MGAMQIILTSLVINCIDLVCIADRIHDTQHVNKELLIILPSRRQLASQSCPFVRAHASLPFPVSGLLRHVDGKCYKDVKVDWKIDITFLRDLLKYRSRQLREN